MPALRNGNHIRICIYILRTRAERLTPTSIFLAFSLLSDPSESESDASESSSDDSSSDDSSETCLRVLALVCRGLAGGDGATTGGGGDGSFTGCKQVNKAIKDHKKSGKRTNYFLTFRIRKKSARNFGRNYFIIRATLALSSQNAPGRQIAQMCKDTFMAEMPINNQTTSGLGEATEGC